MLQHIFLSLLMYMFMLAVVWLSQWYPFYHGPAHGKGGAALCSLVALSPVLPWIALPVAFLLPTHRLRHENWPQYLLGAR